MGVAQPQVLVADVGAAAALLLGQEVDVVEAGQRGGRVVLPVPEQHPLAGHQLVPRDPVAVPGPRADHRVAVVAQQRGEPVGQPRPVGLGDERVDLAPQPVDEGGVTQRLRDHAARGGQGAHLRHRRLVTGTPGRAHQGGDHQHVTAVPPHVGQCARRHQTRDVLDGLLGEDRVLGLHHRLGDLTPADLGDRQRCAVGGERPHHQGPVGSGLPEPDHDVRDIADDRTEQVLDPARLRGGHDMQVACAEPVEQRPALQVGQGQHGQPPEPALGGPQRHRDLRRPRHQVARATQRRHHRVRRVPTPAGRTPAGRPPWAACQRDRTGCRPQGLGRRPHRGRARAGGRPPPHRAHRHSSIIGPGW
ncbi:hypothetical protein ENKNEFLB_00784 [Nocardioides aquaticus]|uniref:Uncharacterized protein n=1 Tax=Nocardioides aquaticus TaxID=160826 RepID=A0ABX8EH63_9ACTN|nr:hypothetical protein ENKNEFLB_00784 [Nocardioides aquaticus]